MMAAINAALFIGINASNDALAKELNADRAQSTSTVEYEGEE